MDFGLLILVIALFALFIWQKKNTDKAITTIQELQQKNSEEISTKIDEMSENFSKDVSNVSESVNSLKETVDMTSSEMNSSLQEAKENTVVLRGELTTQFESVDLKIKSLTDELASVKEQNAKLKKDLEFFTKIDEDATKLNDFADEEQQEALIQKALEQISGVETNQVSEENKSESKTSEQAEKESQNLISEVLSSDSDAIIAPSILDEEQRVAFDTMSNTKQNLFITGKAGTGKSFLLKLFVRANKEKKVVLLAPTGISAINIGGATLHSAFGYTNLVNASIEELEKGIVKLNRDKRQVLASVDTIIIDEISMVRSDTFEKIDRILKNIARNDKLFGGKQLILFGDLFQLPPIAKPDEYRFLQDRFGGIYFFNSDIYKKADFKFIELSINHRQQDDVPFFNVLNRIREGKINSDDLSVLNQRTSFDEDDLRRVIRLFPRKDEAERVNIKELEKIKAKEYIYDATVTYSKPNMTTSLKWNSFPIDEHLRLRLGALVMMVANDTEKRWANGTLGIVSALGEDYIKVKISDSKGHINEYTLVKFEFEEQEAIYRNKRIEYESIFKVKQFPVTLAYAITIHKSQGMTYQQIACDITECFTTGQAYVALSRCSSLAGLYLLKDVDANILNVDPDVKEFYLNQINK